MTMLLILCLCIAFIPWLILICHMLFQHSKRGRTINKIPGLPTIPLLGNALSFIVPTDEFWPKVSYLLKKYYPIFKAWGFVNCAAFVCHPEDLKILLSCKKNIQKCDVVYGNLKLADIDGLISSDGPRWQHRRKILNQGFSATHLEYYSEKMNNRAIKFVNVLKSQGDIFVANISPMLLKFALGAVCDAVMGFDTDSMPVEKEKEFRAAVDEFFAVALIRTVRVYIKDFMMPFLPIGWRLAKVRKAFNSFRWKIIKERRKYHESEGYNIFEACENNKVDDDTTNIDGKGSKKNLAVIDTLLIAERKGLINDHGIAEEVLNIAAAGYETTGMAMAFLFTLLAEHNEHQNLARAEILEILGNDECLTINHVKKMAYLDRCVKEALRLFPTAPHIGRNITDDIKLSKHTLPAGMVVVMSLYDLHRDEHFWPDPDKFDPDRFLPDNVKKRHPFAYLPFSAGPRNCIGQKLATAEMKLMTAHILYNFYLEPIDVIADLKLNMHFTIKANPINLKFVRIDRD